MYEGQGRGPTPLLAIELPKTILGNLLFFTINVHFQGGETVTTLQMFTSRLQLSFVSQCHLYSSC